MWHNSWQNELRYSWGFTGANAWGLRLELVWKFGGVIEVVGGVVFSLTQLDSVELVVSSLTNWYTSESSVN